MTDIPLPAAAVELAAARRARVAGVLARAAAARWPIRLLVLLMAASGCGWYALAVPSALLPGVAPWVVQAMPGIGVLHFAAAAGVWERRRWAWIAAIVYVAAGAASLLPGAAAAVPLVPWPLLALGSPGVAALPALALRRRELLSPSAMHGGPPLAEPSVGR